MTAETTEQEQHIEEIVDRKLAERLQTRSRRDVLAAAAGVAGAGALGYFGGATVAADPSQATGTVYFEQIGDATYPVSEMYVDQQTVLNQVEQFDEVDVLDRLDIPVYSDDSNVPNETHYWHDGVDELRYKDATGVVHSGGGDGLWEEDNGIISPTTTEKAVSVEEASINGYNVFVQDTEPTAENVGDVWIDNSEAFE